MDEEDKTTALIRCTGSNYKSKSIVINESGLYSLILSSKLDRAREFKHWGTSEVLPQIRMTGGSNRWSRFDVLLSTFPPIPFAFSKSICISDYRLR